MDTMLVLNNKNGVAHQNEQLRFLNTHHVQFLAMTGLCLVICYMFCVLIHFYMDIYEDLLMIYGPIKAELFLKAPIE